MDPSGRIYRDLEENIPAEHKARLDGYLIARAEMDEKERLKAREEELMEALRYQQSDRVEENEDEQPQRA